MKRAALALVLCLLVSTGRTSHAEESKTPPGLSCDYTAASEVDRNDPRSLLRLAACLGDSDPAIRDELAYLTLADILRNQTPDKISLLALQVYLSAIVQADDLSLNDFAPPFAILVLSEVARTDRIEPWMSPKDRTELITLGTNYLADLTDYRGFSDEEGWRHGVAHTADLFMQFSLNDAITKSDAERILDAIAGKVAPTDAPAYVYGEPDRLARPILFLARSGLVSEEQWTAFFKALKPDESDPRWQAPYMSEAGLAAIHNTKAFAMVLYVNASVSEGPALAPLLDGSLQLLSALP